PHPAHLHSPGHAPPPTPTPTLSLHDALPIYKPPHQPAVHVSQPQPPAGPPDHPGRMNAHRPVTSEDRPGPDQGAPRYRSRAMLLDRKSTRLNSSHVSISYAVFWLKKKRRSGR